MSKECEADLIIEKSTLSSNEMFGDRGGELELTAFVDCDNCNWSTEGFKVSSQGEAEEIISKYCPLNADKSYEI